MRITGGQAAGRRLRVPAGAGVRPTAARVREALFDTLAAKVVGGCWLDLYGGSGSIALEAASRGARAVVVEPNRAAVALIRRNRQAVGLEAAVEVLPWRAETAVTWLRRRGTRFDVVVCDPPWKVGISEVVRSHLAALLAPDGVLVVEQAKQLAPVTVPGLVPWQSRRYGDTVLHYYRWPEGEDKRGVPGHLSRDV
ncbi:MAG: 16S rRNA (guanine(966)-N(2))-methyltransferase RsmD [Firmicutes bacterium]|nr:16S rRNA (guanine(966)-N(2))-methyltransferase RsmD [Alicyclobacillaceae bacterium]MCL6496389.1 16S rRNA (guanine(966)-N(2))-methyltransferase RsmD [Bacillota bacterium]